MILSGCEDKNYTPLRSSYNDKIEIINDSSRDEILRNVYADGFLIGKFKGIESMWDMRTTGLLTVKFNDLFEEIKIKRDGRIRNDQYVIPFIFFKSLDCQGDIYVRSTWTDFGLTPLLGRVFDITDDGLYYYENNSQNAYNTTINSMLFSNNNVDYQCTNNIEGAAGIGGPYLKLKPNNPDITGIEDYPFPLPLTIEGIDNLNIIAE